MSRLLLVDNFDSFSFNLVQYLRELDEDVTLIRHNEEPPADYELLVISPGPGTPQDAGCSKRLIAEAGVPVLGICLGHQCIAEIFGARVVRATYPMHGKTSEISHCGTGLFEGLPQPLTVTRYHSLTVDPATVPDCLEVIATTDEGEIMALRHRERAIYGVQFHPESILTQGGHQLLRNFTQLAAAVV